MRHTPGDINQANVLGFFLLLVSSLVWLSSGCDVCLWGTMVGGHRQQGVVGG